MRSLKIASLLMVSVLGTACTSHRRDDHSYTYIYQHNPTPVAQPLRQGPAQAGQGNYSQGEMGGIEPLSQTEDPVTGDVELAPPERPVYRMPAVSYYVEPTPRVRPTEYYVPSPAVNVRVRPAAARVVFRPPVALRFPVYYLPMPERSGIPSYRPASVYCNARFRRAN